MNAEDFEYATMIIEMALTAIRNAEPGEDIGYHISQVLDALSIIAPGYQFDYWSM